jgi:hypothetical protein
MLRTAPVIWKREGVSSTYSPQVSQSKHKILTGIPSFLNIATPFRVSMRATFCGVETMTEPARENVRL